MTYIAQYRVKLLFSFLLDLHLFVLTHHHSSSFVFVSLFIHSGCAVPGAGVDVAAGLADRSVQRPGPHAAGELHMDDSAYRAHHAVPDQHQLAGGRHRHSAGSSFGPGHRICRTCCRRLCAAHPQVREPRRLRGLPPHVANWSAARATSCTSPWTRLACKQSHLATSRPRTKPVVQEKKKRRKK